MVGHDRVADMRILALGPSSVVWSNGVAQKEEAGTDRRCCRGRSHQIFCCRLLTLVIAFDPFTVDASAIIAPIAPTVGYLCHHFSPVPHHDCPSRDDRILASSVSQTIGVGVEHVAELLDATIHGSSISGRTPAGSLLWSLWLGFGLGALCVV